MRSLKINPKLLYETGETSAGKWIKYADGRMIITQRYLASKISNVAMGSLYRCGLTIPPDFPIPFTEIENVQISLDNAWLGWLMGSEFAPSLTNATGETLIPLASTQNKSFDNVGINIRAEGKWK